MHNQKTRLIRLPPEIRQIIFKLVVGSRNILIDEAWKSSLERDCGLCYRSRFDNVGLSRYNYWTKAIEQPEPLSPIRLLCRQIFFDTFFLPYSMNIFTFYEECHLNLWRRGLQMEHQRAVRTLLLDMDDNSCLSAMKVVESFKGLRDLYLVGLREVPLPEAEDLKMESGTRIHYLGQSTNYL